jgi:hypothetical protein
MHNMCLEVSEVVFIQDTTTARPVVGDALICFASEIHLAGCFSIHTQLCANLTIGEFRLL